MNDNVFPSAPDDVVRVFVSYARDDRRWLDPDYRFSLISFLMESLRRHKVAFWFDKELKPGDEFKRHIESQIDQSQIALLIVSQSFLNSEFIETREMPRIAERARLGKMIVVPVLVEPCDWSEYPFLADRQMVPSSPLIEYTESEPQWAKVRYQILDGLKAQLKRIREAPQSLAPKAQAIVPEEVQQVAALVEIPEPSKAPTVETAPHPPSQKQRYRKTVRRFALRSTRRHELRESGLNSAGRDGAGVDGGAGLALPYASARLVSVRHGWGAAGGGVGLSPDFQTVSAQMEPGRRGRGNAGVGGVGLSSVFRRFPPNWIFATWMERHLRWFGLPSGRQTISAQLDSGRRAIRATTRGSLDDRGATWTARNSGTNK